MPQYPSFKSPAGLFASALATSSLALLGSAAEGPSAESTVTVADAAPFSTRNQLRIPVQSERKVRFRISSAYRPPSYEWLISSVINPYNLGLTAAFGRFTSMVTTAGD